MNFPLIQSTRWWTHSPIDETTSPLLPSSTTKNTISSPPPKHPTFAYVGYISLSERSDMSFSLYISSVNNSKSCGFLTYQMFVVNMFHLHPLNSYLRVIRFIISSILLLSSNGILWSKSSSRSLFLQRTSGPSPCRCKFAFLSPFRGSTSFHGRSPLHPKSNKPYPFGILIGTELSC